MARFRCTLCSGEFVADKPACAKCGLDPVVNPRHGEKFYELRTIHFDAPTHVPGIGTGHAACKPALKVGTNNDAWSGEKSCVNCEACKESDAFKAAGPPAVPMAMPLEPIIGRNMGPAHDEESIRKMADEVAKASIPAG